MMEKYTQPRAYFPDSDHGSILLAATSPGGLSLVIFMFIRFAKSLNVLLGVSAGNSVRRAGMTADDPEVRFQRRAGLGGSIRNILMATI